MRLRGLIPRAFPTRLLLVLGLFGTLLWVALTFFRRPAPAGNFEAWPSKVPSVATVAGDASRKLEGDAARRYLENADQGQSLMKAIEIQQYGLKHEKQSPFESRLCVDAVLWLFAS